MTLLSILNLSKSFGTQVLFEDLSFTVHDGDRIGLLGPNGAGKSTLLKIITNIEPADSGKIIRRQGLRLGYASQSPEFEPLSCEKIVSSSARTEDEIEAITKARILLSRAEFSDFSQTADLLSGGWKKRLDIVRSLVSEPDLLLLDEPTNHLDLEGILWLEKLLQKEKVSYMIVSHDRYFLENTCNKIIELNRCYPQGLFISDGAISNFMEHKKAFLEAQREQERSLKATVKQEIEWLRKSPKARTCKSRSRIQKAYELIDDLSSVQDRNKTTKVAIEFSASERETRKLITAKNLCKSLGGKELFKGVDITLSPGTRLGIVGKNGTGKTTLLKILAGQVPQDSGTIKYADGLKLVYFDQHREQIPNNITLKEALCPAGEMVNYRGQFIHVNGWARRFLFAPDRLSLPVGFLSGGERARIQIAKLMLQPADVLFLDEPTNDLDIATLEVIEDTLNEFVGAVALISHDRCLMDRVCTSILGLGSNNEMQLYADYSQWEESCLQTNIKKQTLELKPKEVEIKQPSSRPQKLSYKEQKELDGMENAILSIEKEICRLQSLLEDPSCLTDASKTLTLYRELGDAQTKHDILFARWQELETKAKGS